MTSAMLQQIYRSDQVITPDGEAILLEYEVSQNDGAFLQNLIRERSWITQTLEIGCAYGLSSMFICEAIAERRNAHHVIIDPNQSAEYGSIGIENLKRARYDFHELIEERSEFTLPKLLEQGKEFDFIFIDGWHTLDQVMVDAFYATKLLRPNGILALHDCWMPSVSRAISYLRKYPCYAEVGAVPMEVVSMARKLSNSFVKVVPSAIGKRLLPPSLYYRLYNNQTLVAFEKVAEDTRPWDWYREF